MMQIFAAPAYNIVLIVYLLSLPPACGQIMDHLNNSDMGALYYEITITAIVMAWLIIIVLYYIIRISDAGLL